MNKLIKESKDGTGESTDVSASNAETTFEEFYAGQSNEDQRHTVKTG